MNASSIEYKDITYTPIRTENKLSAAEMQVLKLVHVRNTLIWLEI